MFNFSRNLTKLRTKKRITQEEAASAIGVKLKRYQAWEEGRNKPRMSVLEKICEFYEIKDIRELLQTKQTT